MSLLVLSLKFDTKMDFPPYLPPGSQNGIIIADMPVEGRKAKG